MARTFRIRPKTYYKLKKELELMTRKAEGLEELLKNKTGHYSYEWLYIDLAALNSTNPRSAYQIVNVKEPTCG